MLTPEELDQVTKAIDMAESLDIQGRGRMIQSHSIKDFISKMAAEPASINAKTRIQTATELLAAMISSGVFGHPNQLPGATDKIAVSHLQRHYARAITTAVALADDLLEELNQMAPV
jgi:hypothetical protein